MKSTATSPARKQDQKDDPTAPVYPRYNPEIEAEFLTDPHLLTYYGARQYNVATLNYAIKEIAEGRKLAAIFKGVLPGVVRETAIKSVQDHAEREKYVGAANVGRIGQSVYEAQFGPDHAARYFENAPASNEMVRRVFDPHGSPIDTLRAMADELPDFNGASLLRLERGITFAGLIRYLENGASILPHVDNVGWDLANSLASQQIDIQIAWNAMIDAADDGGVVTVFDRRLSWTEYEAFREEPPNAYALKPEALPRRKVSFRPEAGDIFIFNASLPHAVSETSGRTRYTLSCFIGIDRQRHNHIFS
jgi:hypothetical protein